jgi:hypothetical protein
VTPVLLSVQQKYIMEILRKLGYIRREQLRTLVQGQFSELEISECRMAAMLRQLRYATGDVHLDNSAIWLGEAQPDFQRLEAVDVMLELSEGRPQDFSVKCQSPELLRFSLEGKAVHSGYDLRPAAHQRPGEGQSWASRVDLRQRHSAVWADAAAQTFLRRPAAGRLAQVLWLIEP